MNDKKDYNCITFEALKSETERVLVFSQFPPPLHSIFLCFVTICMKFVHGKKGFVIPTKSFVKIGITKIFCYNKMFGSINKRLVAAAKFLVAATKILCVVHYFVAVTKPFFSVLIQGTLSLRNMGCTNSCGICEHLPRSRRNLSCLQSGLRSKTPPEGYTVFLS